MADLLELHALLLFIYEAAVKAFCSVHAEPTQSWEDVQLSFRHTLPVSLNMTNKTDKRLSTADSRLRCDEHTLMVQRFYFIVSSSA